ncbi:hypothetical protein Tco_1231957 [Tanacetum coccineum]
MSSPGAPSAGPSTPPSYSSGPSTPPSYSSGPSTPPNYSPGSSRNAECSNCKHLRGKISVLKATMDMHMHPEQHTVNSAALLHEVKVIKALHGQEGSFDHHGCKTNGLWAKIVGSSNHLHSSGLLPAGSLRFIVGCGTLVRFWKDTWLGDSPLYLRFNKLYRLEQNKDCLISDRISNGQWCWSWSRPDIGVRNMSSLFTLLSEIGNMVLAPHSDSCVWSLASDGVFSVGITRHYINDHLLPFLL